MIEGCTMWQAYINTRVKDALGVFAVPDRRNSLAEQYQKIRQEFLSGKRPLLSYRCQLQGQNRPYGEPICTRARYFFETSHSDIIAELAGYDDAFFDGVFSLIQQAITYEKQLWNEFNIGARA